MTDAARMVGVVKKYKANYETVAIALRHLSTRTIFHRTLLHFNDPEKEDQQVETSLSALKRSEKIVPLTEVCTETGCTTTCLSATRQRNPN